MITHRRGTTLFVGALTLSTAALLLILIFGLDTANAASWWSAIGSIMAAAVALGLGVDAAYRAESDRRRQSASIAILVSPTIYELRARLDVLHENRELVQADRIGYAEWLHVTSNKFRHSLPLLSELHIPLVVALPPLELRSLVLANEAMRIFKERQLMPETATLADIVRRFDQFLDDALAMRPIVVAVSNQLHILSGVDEQPPWNAPSKFEGATPTLFRRPHDDTQ